MNKPSLIVACTAAFIGMGIAMPQCPGDKAMQEQIDSVRQTEQAMTTKLAAIDGQNRTLQGEIVQMNQMVTQLSSTVVAQKDALDKMDAAVKDLQSHVIELQKKRGKPTSKSHRKRS